jgi:hypothetical protein
MRRVFVANALALLMCFAAARGSDLPPPVVILGRIVMLSDPAARILDRKFDQHVVIDIERVLAGEIGDRRILLGISLQGEVGVRSTEDGLELDETVWKPGLQAIIVARRSDPSFHSEMCDPVFIGTKEHGPPDYSNPHWADLVEWLDKRLQAVRPIAVYCADIADMYPVGLPEAAKQPAKARP